MFFVGQSHGYIYGDDYGEDDAYVPQKKNTHYIIMEVPRDYTWRLFLIKNPRTRRRTTHTCPTRTTDIMIITERTKGLHMATISTRNPKDYKENDAYMPYKKENKNTRKL